MGEKRSEERVEGKDKSERGSYSGELV